MSSMTVVCGSNGVFVMVLCPPGGLKFQPLVSSTFNHLRYSRRRPVTRVTPGRARPPRATLSHARLSPPDPPVRGRPADALVQRPPRPADTPAAGPAPGHRSAGRAGRPDAPLPHGPDPAGG